MNAQQITRVDADDAIVTPKECHTSSPTECCSVYAARPVSESKRKWCEINNSSSKTKKMSLRHAKRKWCEINNSSSKTKKMSLRHANAVLLQTSQVQEQKRSVVSG